ncbi:hypothetical protein [Stappia sp.]|uniref:hypothetical protein n=1 Tax=Stappia sp. TaxID=1870903 RepID=UPI0032D8C8D3
MFFQTTVRLFTGTFKALFSNFLDFLKITWAWGVLLIAAQVFAALLTPAGHFGRVPLAGAPAPFQGAVFAGALVVVFVLCSVPVAWHRKLLLDEAPGFIHLRVWKREIKFLLRGALALLTCIPLLLVALMAAVIWQPSTQLEALVASTLLNFLILPFLLRLSMMLPAVAVDEPMTLGEAFTDSEGLGLPMALAVYLAGLCITAISYGLELALRVLGGAQLASFFIDIAASMVLVVLAVGVMSGGYQILRERKTAEDAHKAETTRPTEVR